MSKNTNFDGPTQLLDSLTGRPVRQFTRSGHYYVRATATRHFWGRVLDGAVFLAAFGLLSLLALPLRSAMATSPIWWELAYDNYFLGMLLTLCWFPALYVYGMIWGTWGLFGDRAAHMRSVRVRDGSLSGPWIGGWRAILWSFLPLYALFFVVSLLDGGTEYSPQYVPLDLDSGLLKGHPPVPDAVLIAKEHAAAEAAAQADSLSRANLPNLYGKAPDGGS